LFKEEQGIWKVEEELWGRINEINRERFFWGQGHFFYFFA
jgi:hypothetical protein